MASEAGTECAGIPLCTCMYAYLAHPKNRDRVLARGPESLPPATPNIVKPFFSKLPTLFTKKVSARTRKEGW